MVLRFFLLFLSLVNLARAMEPDEEIEFSTPISSAPAYDRSISSLTASSFSEEEVHLNGTEVKSFMTRVGLPIEESFFDLIQSRQGSDLKDFVEQNADHDFHGAVTYLFLASSEWIGYTYDSIYRALNCLKGSTLSYSRAYYLYFCQKLTFINTLTFNENFFSKEAFLVSGDLVDYLEYRSLAMQIWGCLKTIENNFNKEDSKRGLFFLRNPYSFEAILLAIAFSQDSFGFMPESYRVKLANAFENALEKLKGEVFVLPKKGANFDIGNMDIFGFDEYFSKLMGNLKPWVTQPYFGVPQEGIEALDRQPTKEIMKKNGKPRVEGKHVSIRLLDDNDASNKRVKLRALSLWEMIINAYSNEIPLQHILHENQRASGSWLHSYEAKGNNMDASVDAVLSTPDLRKAKTNSLLYNRRGDKLHHQLRKRILTLKSGLPKKKHKKL